VSVVHEEIDMLMWDQIVDESGRVPLIVVF
jgi:hypothetical protein